MHLRHCFAVRPSITPPSPTRVLWCVASSRFVHYVVVVVGAAVSSGLAPPSGSSSGLSDKGPLVADMPSAFGFDVGVASVAAGFVASVAAPVVASVVGADATAPVVAGVSEAVVVAVGAATAM